MLSWKIKIRYYSFELRLPGNGPALSNRCIDSKTLNPGILSGAGVLYFQHPSQVFDAGPFWTAKLGHQNKTEYMSHSNTFHIFLTGLSFTGLKIWSNLSRAWKHFRTGLAKPSQNSRAVDQVYRFELP